MKGLVIGSTGVLGRNVVPRFVENGHEVRVLVRRQEQAETYQRMGIETNPFQNIFYIPSSFV